MPYFGAPPVPLSCIIEIAVTRPLGVYPPFVVENVTLSEINGQHDPLQPVWFLSMRILAFISVYTDLRDTKRERSSYEDITASERQSWDEAF